jgi:ABC-type protease/lipase transport system fused ATPase/permease subunit
MTTISDPSDRQRGGTANSLTEGVTSRTQTDLERLLPKVLASLGWCRSELVFESALSPGSPLERLEEAAMILSLLDFSAEVVPGLPASWLDGLDGAVVVQSGDAVDAIVRVNGVERVLSDTGRDDQGVRHALNKKKKVLFIRMPGSGNVETLFYRGFRSRILKGLRQGLLLSFFINAFAVLVPVFTMAVFDRVLGAHAPGSLWPLISGAAIAVICIAFLRRARTRYLAAQFARLTGAAEFAAEIRLLRMPFQALQKQSDDSIGARIGAVRRAADLFSSANTPAVFDAPFILVSIFVIGFVGGFLALVPAIYLLFLIGVAFLVSRVSEKTDPEFIAATRNRSALLHELGKKAPEIRESGIAQAWLGRFAEQTGLAVRGSHKLSIRMNAMHSAGSILATGTALATLALGVLMVLSGRISSGALVATMLLTWRITGPVQAFFVGLPRLRLIMEAFGSLEQSLSIRTVAVQAVVPERTPRTAPSVEVEGAFFRYETENDPALVGVTFKIAPGTVTAVIGPNGAGKTTLLRLLSGAISPQAGQVLLNGVNLRQFDPDELLLSSLILPTITERGADNKTSWSIPFQTVWDPRPGLDQIRATALGLDGVPDQQAPSGEQVREPDHAYILLDDPTGCAGAAEREDFLSFLQNRHGNSTIVFSTHDMSLLQAADNAIVLEDGKLRYFGPANGNNSSLCPIEDCN